jgi:hypothetical protein
MFKPELWQSHNEYRTIVSTMGRKLSRNNPRYAFDSYEEEMQKLLNLNLDSVFDYIQSFYAEGGRPAKNQAQILRSLILFVLLFNKTQAKASLTAWVRDILPCSISLTVLIGCSSADELPPLGSYYDFMNRFWLGSRAGYSRKALLPSQKNGKKPKKVIGSDGKLVEPTDKNSVSARDVVNDIINDRQASDNPEAALQNIFTLLAVIPSIRLGLIHSENLTMSGDGTAVVSHASPYGRRLSSCKASCPHYKNAPRHYSDPDAEWGWDSGKKNWYFGHTLYMLCCRNSSLKTELPLLMKFTSAKRHDSLNFLYAIDDFGRNVSGLSPKNICLDSAHDNLPTYKLLDYWDINALIDINGRAKSLENAPDDITFNKQGHPVCKAGHEMCPWGNDPIKDAHKYRCPLKCRRITECPHVDECSKGNYGRTVYIKNNSDLRFQPRIPRDSQQYKDIYSERTACERVNNRVLNDYCLQYLKIRGKDHFSFWTMLIGICIHLDARHKAANMNTA